MNIAREFPLQPELVTDVMEELLDADIISKNQIKHLKLENKNPKYDPNLLMDIRHEQIKRRSLATLNDNRSIEEKRPVKLPTRIEINHLLVDKEIERFKKELDAERRKLYELAKLSNDYKRNVNKQNNTQLVPVTNVVTQRKTKVANASDMVVKDVRVSIVQSDSIFKKTPIEVCGYRPSTMIVPANNKICLNEQSSFCPHKKISDKKNEIIFSVRKNSRELFVVKDKRQTNQYQGEFYFGRNNEEHSQKKIVNKTIAKWKSFVSIKKAERCSKEERLVKMKLKKYLLSKYWGKWVEYNKYIKKEKEEIRKRNDRREKMSLFFARLEDKKKELESFEVVNKNHSKENINIKERSTKTKSPLPNSKGVITNRLNAQKSIIKEQKEKLKEQEKLIQELKEEKLREEMKTYRENLRITVREAIKQFDSRLQPKIKQLAAKVTVQTTKPECDFVKRMNNRAQERKEKWEIIRLKKQMMEEEKQMKQKEEEEKKRQEEEQIRCKKIQEKKEKMRMQRELEFQRSIEMEILREKINDAKEYYNKSLMKKILEALRKNVLHSKQIESACETYYNRNLLRKCLKQWKENADCTARRNIATADAFYTFNLLSKCLVNWILFYSEVIQKHQVAEDFCDAKLQEKYFMKWKSYTNREHIIYNRKTEDAIAYYNRNLIRKSFNSWRQLPNLMYSKREEEKRIREWREKILEVIPDFKPELIENDEDNTC